MKMQRLLSGSGILTQKATTFRHIHGCITRTAFSSHTPSSASAALASYCLHCMLMLV
jgi:hypothetical protein